MSENNTGGTSAADLMPWLKLTCNLSGCMIPYLSGLLRTISMSVSLIPELSAGLNPNTAVKQSHRDPGPPGTVFNNHCSCSNGMSSVRALNSGSSGNAHGYSTRDSVSAYCVQFNRYIFYYIVPDHQIFKRSMQAIVNFFHMVQVY